MRSIGFSTGALALGDFDKGLALMADRHTSLIELSALREEELPSLMSALNRLHLDGYKYVSVHAPSRLRTMKEAAVADMLQPCIERGWHVVLHPTRSATTAAGETSGGGYASRTWTSARKLAALR